MIQAYSKMHVKNLKVMITFQIYYFTKPCNVGASLGSSFKKRKLMSHKVGKCQKETSSNFELLYKLTFKKKVNENVSLVSCDVQRMAQFRQTLFYVSSFGRVAVDGKKPEEAWKGVLLDLYHHGNCESSRPLGAKPWFFPSS